MRFSSMKSVVATLTISATLLVAAPVATAASVQNAGQTKSTARESKRDTDRFAGVREFINRAVRRITSTGGMTVPIPKPVEETNP